jgi:hypothetical protein
MSKSSIKSKMVIVGVTKALKRIKSKMVIIWVRVALKVKW